jgi:hypothetical protein
MVYNFHCQSGSLLTIQQCIATYLCIYRATHMAMALKKSIFQVGLFWILSRSLDLEEIGCAEKSWCESVNIVTFLLHWKFFKNEQKQWFFSFVLLAAKAILKLCHHAFKILNHFVKIVSDIFLLSVVVYNGKPEVYLNILWGEGAELRTH